MPTLASSTSPRTRLARSELAQAAPGAAGGEDALGLSLDALERLVPVLRLLRGIVPVRTENLAALPAAGPVVLLTNHAGPLPVGALALAAALLLDAPVPRLPRVELEPWTAGLPWIGLVLRRIGHVVAHPRNTAALLDRGEVVVHEPPAALVGRGAAIGPFRREVLSLAARAKATVIPVGSAGTDRVVPVVRLELLGRLLGLRAAPFLLSGIPRAHPINLAFGKPRRLEDVPEGHALDALSLELEEEVASLAARARLLT